MKVRVVPRRRLGGEGTRLLEPGDYYVFGEGEFLSVGKVAHVDEARAQVTVEFFAGRPDPGRQEFPEWDLMQRAALKPETTHVDPDVCEAKLRSPIGSGRPSEEIHRTRYPA